MADLDDERLLQDSTAVCVCVCFDEWESIDSACFVFRDWKRRYMQYAERFVNKCKVNRTYRLIRKLLLLLVIWHFNRSEHFVKISMHLLSSLQLIDCFSLNFKVNFRHGKRATINTDDVRLLCRRNPGLLDKIDDYQRLSKPIKSTNRKYTSSRYDDHNVDITVVESSSDIDDIN